MAGSDVRVEINQRAIHLMERGDDPAIAAVMDQAAAILVVGIKRRANVSRVRPGALPAGTRTRRLAGDFPLRPSGYMRSSVAAFRQADGSIIIGPTADYAPYVNDGTPPHEIRSHGPWPLRNRQTGAVYGRVVHHPGYAGSHFVERAGDDLDGRVWHVG